MKNDIYRKLVENVDVVYQRQDSGIDEILEQFMRKFEPLPVEYESANVLAYVSSSWITDQTYDIEPEEVDIEEFEKILNGD